MRKILPLVIVFISLLTLFTLTPSADTSRVYISGESLVTSDELLKIEAALGEAEEATGVKFRAYIASNSYYTSESLILSRLSVSNTDDLAVFLVEKSGGVYYYELFLYGKASNLLDYDDSDSILDNHTIYSSIKSGDVEGGILKFAALTSEMLVENRSSLKVKIIITSIAIALVAGAIAVAIVVYKYKRKLKSPIYPLSKYAGLSLDYNSDQFIGSTVTRTRVNSSSGGGGRSGGRSGGGSRGRR